MYWLRLILPPSLLLSYGVVIVKEDGKVPGREVPVDGFFSYLSSSLFIAWRGSPHPQAVSGGRTEAVRLAARSSGAGLASHLRGIKRVPGIVSNSRGLGGRIGGGGLAEEVFWEVLILMVGGRSWSGRALSFRFFFTIPWMCAARPGFWRLVDRSSGFWDVI
ncbi:uncharacterized protein BT62DRAFT_917788 [Guyanagaster necrorhizus]|uniref:Secreted protein n=1 Tax=Guyanagaster necrorhizus TaxID=856835 RepID=A0A9P7VYB9_9AGAR|nr:uncharacterized protein BT62DRAFT_917788 [Guyanagaster necrorhizus MCA 3950]KAG7449162.1 hypothetical protein BT62DRAFT_917788 [Guyanagaster necrorhizus MCA 3950]